MKLPIISSDEVIKVLRKAGFSFAPKRGKGSHLAFYKEEANRKLLVIVPKRKELPKGTLMAIIEQAGLTREEFLELLRK
jgi:predicted RNA binding protein YcfA (HicA-like mRNA interferase family)